MKPQDLQGVRVLVVEDHWHVANALKLLLEVEGMEVIGPASTVADAQRLAGEHKLELAVVDINLRGKLAYSLVDELYDLGVRIVVVTGYSAVLPPSTEKVGAILAKPIDGPELLAALRSALQYELPCRVDQPAAGSGPCAQRRDDA